MPTNQRTTSGRTRTRRDLKTAALLFSVAVVLPHLHYLLPQDLWERAYWAVSYARSGMIYASAALIIPFYLRGFKVAFAGLAAVTLVALCLYTAGIDGMGGPLWLLVLYSSWRASVAPRVGGAQLEGYDGAYIVRVPLHSWVGVWQSLLLPWYHARYETRIVVQGNTAWYLHRGRFCKTTTHGKGLLRQGDAEALGRALDPIEENRLNSLVGKRSILGFRDCRRFEL